jgi:hypothetical protein
MDKGGQRDYCLFDMGLGQWEERGERREERGESSLLSKEVTWGRRKDKGGKDKGGTEEGQRRDRGGTGDGAE